MPKFLAQLLNHGRTDKRKMKKHIPFTIIVIIATRVWLSHKHFFLRSFDKRA